MKVEMSTHIISKRRPRASPAEGPRAKIARPTPTTDRNVYSCRLRSFLTACRKEARAQCPALLGGPYRLGGCDSSQLPCRRLQL